MISTLLLTAFISLSNASSVLKTICKSRELNDKKCTIKLENYRIDVRKEEMYLFEKQKKVTTFSNPFSSDYSEWVEVKVTKIKGHNFLEFVAWDMPGNSGQNLVHMIYELKKDELKPLTTQVMQLRSWDEERKTYDKTPKSTIEIKVTPSGTTEIYRDNLKLPTVI
jgi:hypothetical protein